MKNFSIFLENSLATQGSAVAYQYEKPLDIISVSNPMEIGGALTRMEEALDQGHHLAGWISYEAGLSMEEKLSGFVENAQKIPLIHMGVFKGRKPLSAEEVEDHWRPSFERSQFESSNFTLNVDYEAYEKAVNKIHHYLRAGDIYQVNYTLKTQFDFKGLPEDLYASLRKAQRVEFGAFMKTDHLSILSLSPELFFRKQGTVISARPMKGTCARGRGLEEDKRFASELHQDEKNRAENLMIVDLLRNDLSKIATPGSVKVESLFDVERYRTLFQMTSTIKAELPETVGPIDIIRAIFPCGSITGAPKIRAMEIIDELEESRRGIYTGAIGFITPQGDACFSVPIRTLVIDDMGQGEMGIGSAIVADSSPEKEYEECLLKANFVEQSFPEFDLIESILYEEGKGYDLLEEHLNRIRDSAEYFAFAYERDEIMTALSEQADFMKAHGDGGAAWKCRLLLSLKGEISVTSERLAKTGSATEHKIILSDRPVSSKNPMIFHKTTERAFYNQELARGREKVECYDVIFLNEDGALCEGTYSNLFIEKQGVLYTPPVSAGLLNGIYRQSLLKQGLQEKNLYPQDLQTADQIFMGNSVRGLVRVSVVN